MNQNNCQFGPWTTTLHYSNRLELSSFWKQRLGRLAAIQSAPQHLRLRQWLPIAVIACGLLVMPRVKLQSIVLAGETNELTAIPSTADTQNPFIATFSNGVGVKLIGLSENPSRDKPWWKPDGSPLETRPYEQLHALSHSDGDSVRREFCWRWLDKPNDAEFETKWEIVPGVHGAGGGVAFDAANREIDGLSAWAISLTGSSGRCSVKFSASVANTPWRTVFSVDGKNESGMSRRDLGDQIGATFGVARAEGKVTEIVIGYQIPNQAVRLVAVDKEGNTHQPSSSTGGGAMDFNVRTYRFSNLSTSQIKQFELQVQTRTFETIEFRNVSLDPSKRTAVEIVRLPVQVPRTTGPGVTPKSLIQAPWSKALDPPTNP